MARFYRYRSSSVNSLTENPPSPYPISMAPYEVTYGPVIYDPPIGPQPVWHSQETARPSQAYGISNLSSLNLRIRTLLTWLIKPANRLPCRSLRLRGIRHQEVLRLFRSEKGQQTPSPYLHVRSRTLPHGWVQHSRNRRVGKLHQAGIRFDHRRSYGISAQL